jgi:hypothetical protein
VKFDGSQEAQALNPAVAQYGGLNHSQQCESSYRLVLFCVIHKTMHYHYRLGSTAGDKTAHCSL